MIFNKSIKNKEKSGFDMTLTIDNKLQQYAYDIMGGKNGSIIVMDNKTGAIRAMASNPTFDPSAESLLKNWEELAESDDAPFVARAISGLYAPGSTWKMITASAAIEAGLSDKEYDDEGKAVIGGREYENSGGIRQGGLKGCVPSFKQRRFRRDRHGNGQGRFEHLRALPFGRRH